MLLGGERADQLVVEHRAEAHDRVDRRPQLVGEDAQELILHAVVLLQRLDALLLQRLGPPAGGDLDGEHQDARHATLGVAGRVVGEVPVGGFLHAVDEVGEGEVGGEIRLATLDDALQQGDHRLARRAEDRLDRLADDLLGLEAPHARLDGVDPLVDQVGVHKGQARGHVLDEALGEGPLLVELLHLRVEVALGGLELGLLGLELLGLGHELFVGGLQRLGALGNLGLHQPGVGLEGLGGGEDALAREHLLGDLGAGGHQAVDGALGVAQRLVDEVPVGGLPPAVTLQLDHDLVADEGAARGVDALEQLEEALALELGRDLAQGLADNVVLPDGLAVERVGEGEDHLGAAQDGHDDGGLLQGPLVGVALGAQPGDLEGVVSHGAPRVGFPSANPPSVQPSGHCIRLLSASPGRRRAPGGRAAAPVLD
ncbi:hypothetical protein D3C72_769070 [compost metagenome]